MINTQVVHSGDLGETLKIVAGKLEVDANDLVDDIRAAEIAQGVFPNTYTQFNSSAPYIFQGDICSQLLQTEPTYEKLSGMFDAAVAANPSLTRYIAQFGSSSWGWTKYADGNWYPGTHHKQSGVNGYLAPQARCVNDATNPLFVNRNAEPVDISDNVSTYNLKPNSLMRLVTGASATWEVHKPVHLRSLELLADVKITGYALPALEAQITYLDGTVVTATAKPYTSGWYMGDIINNESPVKSIKMTVTEEGLAEMGKQPSHFAYDFAGKRYVHSSEASYAALTPVASILYIYGYGNKNIKRFYDMSQVVDITSEYTATANVASKVGFEADKLLDGNAATYYMSNTSGNAVTFKLDKIVGSANHVVSRVELALTPLVAGDAAEPVMNSISRVVVTTSNPGASSSNTSNTRDLKGLRAVLNADGNSVIALHAASPNVFPDVTSTISVALTKTVAGNFKVAGIKVFGHSPLTYV